LLLTLMVCFQEVAEFALANSPRDKLQKTLDWMEPELMLAFGGKYAGSKRKKEELLANIIEFYVNS